MPVTNPPLETSNNAIVLGWENGSSTDPLSKLKRVTTESDDIKATDLNELRAYVELLFQHTHEYSDQASSTTVNNGC
jgi:hypothetical protein